MAQFHYQTWVNIVDKKCGHYSAGFISKIKCLSIKLRLFSYPSVYHMVWMLIETVLLSTHNIHKKKMNFRLLLGGLVYDKNQANFQDPS